MWVYRRVRVPPSCHKNPEKSIPRNWNQFPCILQRSQNSFHQIHIQLVPKNSVPRWNVCVQSLVWTNEKIITKPKTYMGVSENSGTPKSSIQIGISIINHPFWGTPIFGNTHKCISRESFFSLQFRGIPLAFCWCKNIQEAPPKVMQCRSRSGYSSPMVFQQQCWNYAPLREAMLGCPRKLVNG